MDAPLAASQVTRERKEEGAAKETRGMRGREKRNGARKGVTEEAVTQTGREPARLCASSASFQSAG